VVSDRDNSPVDRWLRGSNLPSEEGVPGVPAPRRRSTAHPLLASGYLVLGYDALWSKGTYRGAHGEHLASFQSHDDVIEVRDDAGRPTCTILTNRSASRGTPFARRFRPGTGFTILDEHAEPFGVVRPRSGVLGGRWAFQLEARDQRATLRANTALARWNSGHSEKILVLDLVPTSAGSVTMPIVWDGSSPATPTIRVSVRHLDSALDLLVIAAPLCFPPAGLTGVDVGAGIGPNLLPS
jgi:hypothetical protein